MGCAFSSSALSGPGSLPPFSGVRVIHTNGYVEDFPGPGVVTVAHVTASNNNNFDGSSAQQQPPRYVLCSSAHLLQPGRGAFRPDDALQPGTVYFLLPHSVFQAESSAVDLACLMNRLTALARKGCAAAASTPSNKPGTVVVDDDDNHQQEQRQKAKQEAPARAAPWRPRLERIDESIGRASSRSSTFSEA